MAIPITYIEVIQVLPTRIRTRDKTYPKIGTPDTYPVFEYKTIIFYKTKSYGTKNNTAFVPMNALIFYICFIFSFILIFYISFASVLYIF